MEKILVAIDANQINVNTVDFACYIARLTHSKLMGVFLDNGEKSPEPVAQSVPGRHEGTLPGKEKVRSFDSNIDIFKNACTNRQTNCSLHHDQGVPVAEIIKESRFADLLIVDPEMSFRGKKENVPTAFTKEVLTKSECPVVIAPFTFYGINEIVFAYDGSQSAVFAIKQFTYLFPELTDKKITILQVNENDDDPVIEMNKIGELLQMHYFSIGFHCLSGNPGIELYRYLLGKKNAFVVMGAFGRSMVSDFFKHSTADLLVKTIDLPVFVAHH